MQTIVAQKETHQIAGTLELWLLECLQRTVLHAQQLQIGKCVEHQMRYFGNTRIDEGQHQLLGNRCLRQDDIIIATDIDARANACRAMILQPNATQLTCAGATVATRCNSCNNSCHDKPQQWQEPTRLPHPDATKDKRNGFESKCWMWRGDKRPTTRTPRRN